MLQKNFFWISAFFGPFLNQKTAKKQPKKNWQNPNRLMKFSEIWYVDASQQKKCYNLDFGIFWPFFNKKTAKKKIKKLPKSKLFDEIF